MNSNTIRKVIIVLSCFTIGFIIGTLGGKILKKDDEIKKLNNQIIEQENQIQTYKEENMKLRKLLKD
ncbi:LapA family protein [uncultured Clostridium sp.]|uniref:LapA family protein n=1 Tax=uncultured Clostridium sp. TaxID=59620 RepID=UPI0026204F77|nr:LapA family protein [uncultured Clostridium sp.]